MHRKLLFVLMVFFISFFVNARGDFRKDSFIADDEMLETVSIYLSDIFRVAGVRGKPNVVFYVSPDINAAASIGNTIIIFTGFISACKSLDQFVGVLAHETGHIAGGHPVLTSNAVHQAAMPALIATALGGIAALAGGGGGALMAGMAAGATIFERGFLKYSRTQEEGADSAAIGYLTKLNWPVGGLESFLKMIDRKYTTGREDVYTMTHPLTSERMRKINIFTKSANTKHEMPADYQKRFHRLRGKVNGYINNPQKTLRDYPITDHSIEAKYARAIAYYRLGKYGEADQILSTLSSQFPKDTYLYEMRGQFAFEMGKLQTALSYFKKTYNRPFNSGVTLMYAHCLIEANKDLNLAVKMLNKSLSIDKDNIFAWRLMAKAYGKQNKTADASAALAEEAWLMQEYKLAKRHAERGKNAENPRLRQLAKDIFHMADKQ